MYQKLLSCKSTVGWAPIGTHVRARVFDIYFFAVKRFCIDCKNSVSSAR